MAITQNQNITKTATVRLPNTCPQNRRQFTYVRILTQVDPNAWNGAGFEGTLYQPGARVAPEILGAQPVLLEFAGPQGTWRQRNRERDSLWLLWRFDWDVEEWREIARAVSKDWHWALVLREPAIRALRPPAAELAIVDPARLGSVVTEELLAAIDAALSPEPLAVRKAVLSAVYDSMAGRLAAAA